MRRQTRAAETQDPRQRRGPAPVRANNQNGFATTGPGRHFFLRSLGGLPVPAALLRFGHSFSRPAATAVGAASGGPMKYRVQQLGST